MAKMGRPRSFDRDEAIQQAMHLFWRHGYESTSLSALTSAIGGGITPPSFYAAFGSKEGLFREVVELYVATHGQVNASLWDKGLPPREAIEQALRRSARMQTENSHPKGCLLVISAGACSPENDRVQMALAEQRARTREGVLACVSRAVAAGELSAGTDARSLAATINTFLLGLTTQARDGVPFETLNSAVTELMSVWDRHAA